MCSLIVIETIAYYNAHRSSRPNYYYDERHNIH